MAEDKQKPTKDTKSPTLEERWATDFQGDQVGIVMTLEEYLATQSPGKKNVPLPQ